MYCMYLLLQTLCDETCGETAERLLLPSLRPQRHAPSLPLTPPLWYMLSIYLHSKTSCIKLHIWIVCRMLMCMFLACFVCCLSLIMYFCVHELDFFYHTAYTRLDLCVISFATNVVWFLWWCKCNGCGHNRASYKCHVRSMRPHRMLCMSCECHVTSYSYGGSGEEPAICTDDSLLCSWHVWKL